MIKISRITSILVLILILILIGTTIYNYFRTSAIVESYHARGIVEYKFNQLPAEYQDILIKVQDPGFYSHKGVDFNTPGAGWTTITQSLSKFFYFEDFKPGWRKIPQTIYARFALHPKVAKENQLDLFINIIGFGNGTRGILSASQFYFNSKPDELTKDEYISLIAILNNPKMLNPMDNPDANSERARRIKKYINGEYVPKNVFDNEYEDA
jgi:membrane carboxypeptidase/penicillin-binding protein